MIVIFVPFFLKILEERSVEDQKKALLLLAQNERASIYQNYKEARNIITQALKREILTSIGTYLHLSAKETEQLKNLGNKKDTSAFASIDQ